MAYRITETGDIDKNAPLTWPISPPEKVKEPRNVVIARNIRREKTLTELWSLINNKPPSEPFDFKVNNCSYRVEPGNFCAVEFYNKIKALSPTYF